MNRSRFGRVLVFSLFSSSTAAIHFCLYQQHPSSFAASFVSENGRKKTLEVDVPTDIAGRSP